MPVDTAASNPVVVIDNGTGFTKMGYAGNTQPQFIIPTAISVNMNASDKCIADLDFYIGDEAIGRSYGDYQLSFPIRHGLIQSWDNMEKFWEQCLFKYLKCEPEDHYIMLTEPPLNTPENREYTAEIMFETFNCSGLYIAVQAVLALAASWSSQRSQRLKLSGTMTGTVVDSGDGVTHIIPVVDGYILASSIKHIPLAGRDITNFILHHLKERESNIPPEDALMIAQKIKEQHSYVASDIAKEFNKYDKNPQKYLEKYTGIRKQTNTEYSIDVFYERFLGPELFFNPDIFSSDFTTPLPTLVDRVIQSCPIDTRRKLYSNIVLSGGSTMFKHFGRRLERDVDNLVATRLQKSFERAGGKGEPPKKIDVNVISHPMQRYAVWFGGSMLAGLEGFHSQCKTKKEYDEKGPGICRHSPIFSGITM
jgi:actin-related protein 3